MGTLAEEENTNQFGGEKGQKRALLRGELGSALIMPGSSIDLRWGNMRDLRRENWQEEKTHGGGGGKSRGARFLHSHRGERRSDSLKFESD